ncbi:hypothetical protein Hypma_010168 [Hypsizygus marmoreus]|uniref:Uncharacterized protein n=1 Tax=Hypsizygus marmoreus TaxID=39966 RepID=A0A369JVU3_HYPMA|nr:hypothetical protein Hypma_010168 [Hypsizygus marmoreus]
MSYKGIPSFELKYTLNGHTKPINGLAISADRSLLLSGADDASLIVWSLENGQQTQKITVPFHGPIGAVVWTPVQDDAPAGAFAFGCAAGSIYTYIQSHAGSANFDFASLNTANVGAVESLAFDPYHRRLASIGAGCLNIYDMDINGQLKLLKSTPKRPFIPRSVAFFDRGKNVLVCFLESHEITAYEIDPWSMKWSHQLPTRIGNASLSIDERTLTVSNLKDGIDTYSLPPRQPLRSFRHPISSNVPLSVCSTQDGALMLAGSDDGSPRLFDLRLGSLTQTLPHSHVGGLVQAVTAYSHNGYYLLATGASDIRSITDIKVWAESKADQPVQVQSKRAFLSFTAWQVIVVLLASIAMQMLASQILALPVLTSSSPVAEVKMAVSKAVAASKSVSVSNAVARYIPFHD